jgi:hypothetical protein
LRGHLKGEGSEEAGSQSYVPPDEKDDKALANGTGSAARNQDQSGLSIQSEVGASTELTRMDKRTRWPSALQIDVAGRAVMPALYLNPSHHPDASVWCRIDEKGEVVQPCAEC